MSKIDVAARSVEKSIPAASEQKESPRALKRTAFQSSEFAYANLSATLPVDWTVEDALKPEFWVHAADMLQKTPVTNEPDKAGAIIELRTVDHAFYARLYVRAAQERGLIVQLLGEPVYFGLKSVESASFETRWNVGKRGYDVIRKSDREIVVDGSKIPTKEAAQDWIDKTLKAH